VEEALEAAMDKQLQHLVGLEVFMVVVVVEALSQEILLEQKEGAEPCVLYGRAVQEHSHQLVYVHLNLEKQNEFIY
jgi:hypothetical protein